MIFLNYRERLFGDLWLLAVRDFRINWGKQELHFLPHPSSIYPPSLSLSALAKLRDSLSCDSLLIHDHFQCHKYLCVFVCWFVWICLSVVTSYFSEIFVRKFNYNHYTKTYCLFVYRRKDYFKHLSGHVLFFLFFLNMTIIYP